MFLSDPLLGPLFAFRGPDAERIELYISAAFYGLPLIAAFLASLRARPWPRATQWRALDRLAIAMSVMWAIGCVRGVVALNETRFILTDSFNFWVPIGVYVAMRALDDTTLIDRWMTRIVAVSVTAQLVWTIWAVWIRGWQSGGLPFFVLFTSWFLHQGSLIGAAASLVLIVATRKRALIVAGVLIIPLFAVLSRRRKLLLASIAIAFAIIAAIVVIPSLRERFTILEKETQHFRSLQVRQDEVSGIMQAIRERDWPLSLVIGQGMGATYAINMGVNSRSKPRIILGYHDTHISPVGWLLRIGILGALAYAAFFLTGAYLCIRATNSSRDAALTSSYLGMLALSLTTFTVPALPIVTVVMMMALVPRNATR